MIPIQDDLKRLKPGKSLPNRSVESALPVYKEEWIVLQQVIMQQKGQHQPQDLRDARPIERVDGIGMADMRT